MRDSVRSGSEGQRETDRSAGILAGSGERDRGTRRAGLGGSAETVNVRIDRVGNSQRGRGRGVNNAEPCAGHAGRRIEGRRTSDEAHKSASGPPCRELSFLQPVSGESYKPKHLWRVRADDDLRHFCGTGCDSFEFSEVRRGRGEEDRPDENFSPARAMPTGSQCRTVTGNGRKPAAVSGATRRSEFNTDARAALALGLGRLPEGAGAWEQGLRSIMTVPIRDGSCWAVYFSETAHL